MMKKLLALFLVLALGLAFAACTPKEENTGGTEASDEVTTTTGDSTTEPTEPDDPTTEPSTDDATTKAPEDETTTKAPEDGKTEATTAKQTGDTLLKDKKEAIALYAGAVDKALAANKTTTKTIKVDMKRPFDGDAGVKKLMATEIVGYNIEETIAAALGNGVNNYTEPMKTALQKCALQEGDVTDFSATKDAKGNTVLTIRVKDCVDPKYLKDGGSPIGRFTGDFADVAVSFQGFKDAEDAVPGLKVTINKITYRYTDIAIKATVKPDGSFEALAYSFKYTVRLEGVLFKLFGVKVGGGGGEWGSTNATVNITYKL